MALRCVVTMGMGNRMATTCTTLAAESKASSVGDQGERYLRAGGGGRGGGVLEAKT